MSGVGRNLLNLMTTTAELAANRSRMRELALRAAPLVASVRKAGARIADAIADRRQREAARLASVKTCNLGNAMYVPEPPPSLGPVEPPSLTLHTYLFSRVLFATAPPALPFRQGRVVAIH